MMDSGTTTKLFGNPNMIKNRKKLDIAMNFVTNAGFKIVYEAGEIPGAGQKKSHPDIIENVMSPNETNKIYRVPFYSGNKNAFKVHMGYTVVKFTAKEEGIYISKPDNNFSRKVTEENKRNIIE